MVEVLPELAFADQLIKIAVSRGQHSNIYRDRFVAAYAFDLAFFQNAQEFCLHR